MSRKLKRLRNVNTISKLSLMRSSKSACSFQNYLRSRMNESLERKQRSPRTLNRHSCVSNTGSTKSDTQVTVKYITERHTAKKKVQYEMQRKESRFRSISMGSPYQKNVIVERILAGNQIKTISTPRSLPDNRKNSKTKLKACASQELSDENISSHTCPRSPKSDVYPRSPKSNASPRSPRRNAGSKSPKFNTRPRSPKSNTCPRSPKSSTSPRSPNDVNSNRSTFSGSDVKNTNSETNRFLKSSTEEHEYLLFLLRITEDIISKDYYTNADIKKVCGNHMEANKGHLDMEKMEAHVARLSKELNIVDETNISQSNVDSEIYYNKHFLDTNSSYSLISADATRKYRSCECATFRKPPLRSLSTSANVTSRFTVHKTSEEINIGAKNHENENPKSQGGTGFQETLKELRDIISEKDIDEKMSVEIDLQNSLHKMSLSRVTECTEPSTSYNTLELRSSNDTLKTQKSSFGNIDQEAVATEKISDSKVISTINDIKIQHTSSESSNNKLTDFNESTSTSSDIVTLQENKQVASEKISGIKLISKISDTKIQQSSSESSDKISDFKCTSTISDTVTLQESSSEPDKLPVTKTRKLSDFETVINIHNYCDENEGHLIKNQTKSDDSLPSENTDEVAAIKKLENTGDNSDKEIRNIFSGNLPKTSFESFFMKISENDLLHNQQIDLESTQNSIKASDNQISITESISEASNSYSNTESQKQQKISSVTPSKTMNSDQKLEENSNLELDLLKKPPSENLSNENVGGSITGKEHNTGSDTLRTLTFDGISKTNSNVESEIYKKYSFKSAQINDSIIKESEVNKRHNSEIEVVKKSSNNDAQSSNIIQSPTSPVIKVILEGELSDQDYMLVNGPVYVLKALIQTDPKLVVFANNNNTETVENTNIQENQEAEAQNENDSGPDSLKSNATYTVSEEPEPDLESLKSFKNDQESVESIFRIPSDINFFESKKNLELALESHNKLLYNSDYDLTPQRDENNYFMGSDISSDTLHRCSSDKYHFLMVDATTSVSNLNINSGLQCDGGDFYLDSGNMDNIGNNLLLGSDEYVLEEVDSKGDIPDLKENTHSLEYYFKLRKKFSESEYVNIPQLKQSQSVPKPSEVRDNNQSSSQRKLKKTLSLNKLKTALGKGIQIQSTDEYLTESESFGEIRGDIVSKLNRNGNVKKLENGKQGQSKIAKAETLNNTNSMTSMESTLQSEGETVLKVEKKLSRALSAPHNILHVRKEILNTNNQQN